MTKNWIIGESRKAHTTRDYVVLEHPETRRNLDDLLLTRFWPGIRETLEETGYDYMPQEAPRTDFELGPELTRSLHFMLLDGRRSFSRGRLKCSRAGWMLESEFFLGLHETNDRNVLFEILGNSGFAGNPPKLLIYKGTPHYFEVTFSHGRGASWGLHGEEEVDRRIREMIDVNTEMYELSSDGRLTAEDFAPFLTFAYQIYQAY